MKNYKKIFILIVILHLILVSLTLSGKLSNFFNDASLRKGIGADFFALYQAGDNFFDGESIYLDNEGDATPYSFPFRYPPFAGYALGAFFSLFSPFWGYSLLIIIYELILFLNIFITSKLSKSKDNFILASAAWLLFSPYLLELFMGQWTFLITSLLFYTVYGLLKSKNSKFFIALASIVKPNSLIIAPLLLKLKEYKNLLVTGSTFLLTSASYFLFYKNDLAIFMKNFQDKWYSHGGNFGFKSLYYIIFIRELSIPWPRIWFLGFIFTLGLFSLYLTLKSKSKILIFSLWICFYFFFYTDVWEHHYTLLMPVFALIFASISSIKEKVSDIILPLISFLLISLPSMFILQFIFTANAPYEPDNLNLVYTLVYHSQKILGVAILYIWIAMKILFKENKV